ncbi:MAG: hypothetical protein HYY37_03885 [Candidatus Aenigmarchaeota archaeon]|nr:hypothetical protein [Candidatus Aenigmarchaeota archaeon]
MVSLHKCAKNPDEITIKGFNPDNDPLKEDNGDTLGRACELSFGWYRGTARTDPERQQCKLRCGCPPE